MDHLESEGKNLDCSQPPGSFFAVFQLRNVDTAPSALSGIVITAPSKEPRAMMPFLGRERDVCGQPRPEGFDQFCR